MCRLCTPAAWSKLSHALQPRLSVHINHFSTAADLSSIHPEISRLESPADVIRPRVGGARPPIRLLKSQRTPPPPLPPHEGQLAAWSLGATSSPFQRDSESNPNPSLPSACSSFTLNKTVYMYKLSTCINCLHV